MHVFILMYWTLRPGLSGALADILFVSCGESREQLGFRLWG